MTAVLTCSLASRDAYSDQSGTIAGYHPVAVPEAKRINSTGSSFFGATYSAGKRGIIAFRGSQEITDWLEADRDIGLSALPVNQLGDAFAYFSAAVETLLAAGCDEYVVTGHSLGGGLAEVVACAVSRFPVSAVTFNAPGLMSYSAVLGENNNPWIGAGLEVAKAYPHPLVRAVASLFERVNVKQYASIDIAHRHSRVINVRARHDRVSRVGFHVGQTHTVDLPGTDWWEPIEAHSLDNLIEVLVDHPIGRQKAH